MKTPDEHESHSWISLHPSGDFVVRKWSGGTVDVIDTPASLLETLASINSNRLNRCRNTKFAILGDSRSAYDGLGGSIFWQAMLDEIRETEPDLILHVGDLVKNGRSRQEWQNFIPTIPRMPPLVSVRGNHDRGPYFYGWGIGVSEVFKLDYGAVRIFGLDTEGGVDAVRSRLARFENLLRAPSDQWKIVILHRPIWSQGLHGSDELGLNQELIRLFDTYGVQLVLSGHDHNYERFCPTLGTRQSRTCLSPNEAPSYVITGGGATMPNPIPTFWRRWGNEAAQTLARTSVVYSGSLHYVELDASSHRLEFRAIRSRVGNIFAAGIMDQLSWTRENTTCP